MARTLFLKWLLFAMVIFVGAVMLYQLGGFHEIDRMDASKISFLIIAVFSGATAWCGILAWRFDDAAKDDNLSNIERKAEHGWFAAVICEKLGLLGTIWGFMMILVGGFSTLQNADQQALTTLLERVGAGMATAFLTTLVGLVSSILLTLQYHALSTAIDGARHEKTP